MRLKAMLFLVLALPVMITGMNFQMLNNPFSQDEQISLRKASLLVPSAERDRNWRLESMERQSDTNGDGTLDEVLLFDHYYNAEHPARVDSIWNMHWSTDMENWAYTYTQKFIYDATGEYITQEQIGVYVSPTPFIIIDCEYDAMNRLTDYYQYNYNWSQSEYELTVRVNFAYGTNTLNQMMKINPGNSRSYYEKNVYDHDGMGRITSIDTYGSPDSVNWGQIRHEEILYANFDTSSGAEYISYLSHNLLTDLDWEDGFYGKIASVYKCEDWTGTTWNDQYVSIYNYDAVFQLSEIMTEKLGGVFTNYSKDIFDYDINGNLQIHIHRMYDMVNGILLTPDEVEQYNFGMYTHNNDETVIPTVFSLSAYPNPFNNVVTINLQNKSNAPIETSIYNIKGQLVRNLGSSRNSSIIWDGKDNKNLLVGNGIYFIRAEQDGRAVSKKVIRMR